MKRKDVIRRLEENGYVLKRHGANHDIYFSAAARKTIPVKRHGEIDDLTAAEIFKEAGVPR